jgi:hypothetical protein
MRGVLDPHGILNPHKVFPEGPLTVLSSSANRASEMVADDPKLATEREAFGPENRLLSPANPEP